MSNEPTDLYTSELLEGIGNVAKHMKPVPPAAIDHAIAERLRAMLAGLQEAILNDTRMSRDITYDLAELVSGGFRLLDELEGVAR